MMKFQEKFENLHCRASKHRSLMAKIGFKYMYVKPTCITIWKDFYQILQYIACSCKIRGFTWILCIYVKFIAPQAHGIVEALT